MNLYRGAYNGWGICQERDYPRVEQRQTAACDTVLHIHNCSSFSRYCKIRSSSCARNSIFSSGNICDVFKTLGLKNQSQDYSDIADFCLIQFHEPEFPWEAVSFSSHWEILGFGGGMLHRGLTLDPVPSKVYASQLHTVWQFGGCHTGVAGDSGLLGCDGTSLGDWFLTLRRIVTLFFLDWKYKTDILQSYTTLFCVISGFRHEVDEDCTLQSYYAASSDVLETTCRSHLHGSRIHEFLTPGDGTR